MKYHNKKLKCNSNKTVDIPVIIANKKIDIDLKDKIKVKEGFIDILDIKNDLYITEAKCINIRNVSNDKYKDGKVFLKGYIRNLIQYTVLDKMYNENITTTVRTLVNYIDFNCTTKVKYLMPVQMKKRKYNMKKIDLKENMSKDIAEFNTPITYNLNKVNIFCDINYYNHKHLKNSNNEKIFYGIQQNISSKLELVLLKNQSVLV